MLFDHVIEIEDHMLVNHVREIAVQDSRGTLYLLAVSADADADECVFYVGVPQEDTDATSGWLVDGVMTDGPSWPLRLLAPNWEARAAERAAIIADLRQWSRPLGQSPEDDVMRLVIERITSHADGAS